MLDLLASIPCMVEIKGQAGDLLVYYIKIDIIMGGMGWRMGWVIR